MKIKNTTDFITQSNVLHSNKYKYSKSKYINLKTKVIVGCTIHGDFSVTPSNHLNRKSGCPVCAYIGRPQNTPQSLQQFVKKANGVHNNKYNYSRVDYKNIHTPVIIICPIHGEFKQRPVKHTSQKCGCPHCTNSSASEDIVREFLKLNEYSFIEQHTFEICTNPKTNKRLKFDFYLPNKNLLIEVDGVHHFRPVRFNGISQERAITLFSEGLKRDKIKTAFAQSSGIGLIRVTGNKDNILNQLNAIV